MTSRAIARHGSSSLRPHDLYSIGCHASLNWAKQAHHLQTNAWTFLTPLAGHASSVTQIAGDPTLLHFTVICAYYALTLTEIDSSLMPAVKRNKFPRRIPGVRLARLAVSLSHQKKGLGELLLVSALERAKRVHTEAGGIGRFVDAIDEHAAAFYRHYGFVASPEQPLLMFLNVGVIYLLYFFGGWAKIAYLVNLLPVDSTQAGSARDWLFALTLRS